MGGLTRAEKVAILENMTRSIARAKDMISIKIVGHFVLSHREASTFFALVCVSAAAEKENDFLFSTYTHTHA